MNVIAQYVEIERVFIVKQSHVLADVHSVGLKWAGNQTRVDLVISLLLIYKYET